MKKSKMVIIAILILLPVLFLAVVMNGGDDYESKGFDSIEIIENIILMNYNITEDSFLLSERTAGHMDSTELPDGRISHYYLTKTAFNDVLGITHKVTARTYLIEGEDQWKIGRITVDDEVVFYDEAVEAECWGM